MKKIAILGIGTMGGAVVESLRRSEYQLRIYNRTRSRAEKLAGKGVSVFASPAEAAAESQVIISFVHDDIAASEVWLGRSGALSKAQPGTICMECATLSVSHIDSWNAKLQHDGFRPFDCPVTGSRAAAQDGTLSLFIGAKATDFHDTQDVLEAISTQQFWLGRAGAGMRFKLLYNMLGGTILVALAEALSLGIASGLDGETIVDILSTNINGWSAAAAASKGQNMVLGKHHPVACSLHTIAKDLSFAEQAAEAANVKRCVSSAAQRVLHDAEEAGLGKLDMSSVAEVILNRINIHTTDESRS